MNIFISRLVDPSLETPKPKDFEGLKVHNILLADNGIICEAAKKRAEELGYNSLILSTVLEGESKEVGIALASIAKEIEEKDRPIKPLACQYWAEKLPLRSRDSIVKVDQAKNLF